MDEPPDTKDTSAPYPPHIPPAPEHPNLPAEIPAQAPAETPPPQPPAVGYTPVAPAAVIEPPAAPAPAAPGPEAETKRDGRRGRRIAGVILILVGLLFYAQYFLPGLGWSTLWPAVLIVIGVYIVFKARKS